MAETNANSVVESASREGRRTLPLAFEAVATALQEPVVVLRRDLSIESANPAFCHLFQRGSRDPVGRSLYEVHNRDWDIPVLRRLLADLMANGTPIKNHSLDREFRGIGRRVLVINAHQIQPKGREPLVVLSMRDNTELESAKEYSAKIVDALRDPFLVLDWELRVKSANAPFYEKFQVEPGAVEGQFIYHLGNRQWNIPRLRELLESVLPKDSKFDDFEVEHDFEGIGHRVMLLNARRINHLKLILLVIEDVTELRRAAGQQRMVMGELQHRIKNLLSTVQALSQLTLQNASSLEDFAESFRGRLDAMARTQDLLLRGMGGPYACARLSAWSWKRLEQPKTPLSAVSDPGSGLSEHAAHAFAMTIHELTTNAAKYGALSAAAVKGRVEMAWNVEVTENGKVALRFTWKEHGVPAPPKHSGKGFGTQIIETSLPHLFGGSANVIFEPDGVACVIKMLIPPEEIAIEGAANT